MLTSDNILLALSSCVRAIWQICVGVLTSINRQRNGK